MVTAAMTDAEGLALVSAALPGAELVEADAETRESWALAYMRHLWGDRAGFVCLATAGLPYIDTRDAYQHKSFKHRFYAWPDEAIDAAHGAIVSAAKASDVYVTPMLRTKRSAKQYTGAGSRFLWADVDGEWTDERADVLERLGESFTVHSGTGRHIYVALDQWTDPETVVNLNKRLRDALDGDHKFSDNALLRPPGTFNRKASTRGYGPPTLVRLEDGIPWD